MSNVISAKWVKTRKPHRCFGCAREFPAGSEMRFDVYVDDRISNAYLCETCIEVIQEYGNDLGFEFCYGDLKDDALEWEEEHAK